MIAVVCILILAALFFIISGFLYGGKGSWLIAGFGTSSREERAKYDEKKVCRAMGVFCTHLRRDALSAGISGQSGGTGANGGSAAPALWHRLSCGAFGIIGRCCPLYP